MEMNSTTVVLNPNGDYAIAIDIPPSVEQKQHKLFNNFISIEAIETNERMINWYPYKIYLCKIFILDICSKIYYISSCKLKGFDNVQYIYTIVGLLILCLHIFAICKDKMKLFFCMANIKLLECIGIMFLIVLLDQFYWNLLQLILTVIVIAANDFYVHYVRTEN